MIPKPVEQARNSYATELRFTAKVRSPEDRDDLLAAVNRTSAQSLYRRLFGLKRSFTDQEAAFFIDVDFVNHVALVALIDEEGRSVIAGGGRYIVVQPGQAEVGQGDGVLELLSHHKGNARAQPGRGSQVRT